MHGRLLALWTSLYQLYYKYKDREWIYLAPFTMMSLAWHVRFFFRVLHSPHPLTYSEDSQWYIDYARTFIEHLQIGLHMDEVLYLGYNLLLAILLYVFKYETIILFIQSFATGLGVILVYLIARKLFNRLTAIIAAFFYYNAWNIAIWSVYILSDSFFILLLLLTVYFLLKTMETRKKVYRNLFIGASVFLFFFRPTGIVSLLFIFIYIGLYLDWGRVWRFLKRHRFVIGGLATSTLVAGIYIVFAGKLEPLFSSMQFNAKTVLYNIYAKGWVYDKPSSIDYAFKPDYTINIGNSLVLSFLINNFDHILVLYGRRMVAFLGYWVLNTDFTSKVGLKKFMGDVLPTLLFMMGMVAAIMSKQWRKMSIVWLVFLSVFVFCIIFFIDGFYRYKAPALPFIYIICAYGLERLIRVVLFFATTYSGMLPWKKSKP